MKENVLNIEDLSIYYHTYRGLRRNDSYHHFASRLHCKESQDHLGLQITRALARVFCAKEIPGLAGDDVCPPSEVDQVTNQEEDKADNVHKMPNPDTRRSYIF